MLNVHIILSFIVPIIIPVFPVCEAAVALPVITSNTFDVDYVQNHNLLQY
jgi:hypothetical protein